jgi:hypothetical protein
MNTHLDLDGGDVLATYAEPDPAVHRARVLVEESPEIAQDIAVVAINSKGERVGEPFIVAPSGADAPASAYGAVYRP